MAPAVGQPEIEQLARAHGRKVFHAAYRVLGNAAQAEDVQQGVFMRLLEHPPRADVENWGAYLAAMATRAAIDEIRKRQRWQRVAERFRLAPRGAEPQPLDVLDGSARADRLRRALARLPKRQAQCFALRFFDGLSLEAIAESLAVTPNAVSVSLHRATNALKQRIDAFESTLAIETDATPSSSEDIGDRDASASREKENAE
ncbi:sigma-70 family RNA polymerase sigma factor [Halomonas denitrificans]|nr:sigma-70 family RNA polymerase sigma factor [Halomonas denitrificans]